jgi:ribosomal protein S15P/S13E
MPKKLDSKKPQRVKISPEGFEKKVLELVKKDLTSEKIGEELKKQGIHIKEQNKKISKILGDSYVNPDIKNVEEKLQRVIKHYEKNKQDKRAKREKDRIYAKLRKLRKYHKTE